MTSVRQNPTIPYISTPDGIYCLKTDDNAFRRVLQGMGKCQLLSKDGSLFIGNSKGLFVYDGKRLTIVDMGGEPNVRAMTLDADGTLYLLTTDAFCKYLENDNRLQRTNLMDVYPAGISFSAFAKVGDLFFVGSKNYGMYMYSDKRGLTKVEGIGNVVNSIVQDSQGNVCISTDGTGAYLLDGRSGKILETFRSTGSVDGIDTDAIYYYWRDENGCNWFCQSHFGIAYTYYDNGLFQTYSSGGFTTAGMMIRSFLLDGKRKLIGTLGGLYLVDESTGKVVHFDASMLGGGNIVTGIERLGDFYYIGTYDAGLHRLGVSSQRPERVEAFANLKGEGTITFIKKAADNRLWIGTNTGVVIMNENEEMTYLNNNNSGIKSGTISSVSFAPDGSRWIGGSHGLSVMSANGDFLSEKLFPKVFFNKEAYLTGSFTEAGQLFMGNRNGIYFTDTKMHKFGKLDIADGLIDETCNSVYCDNDSGLWVTSEKGLFRICINGKRMIHFGYGMGIQSMHFLKGGICAVGDTLWVASPDGLKTMSIKQMWECVNRRNHRIMLYNVMIGSERLSIAEVRNVNISNNIRLTWNFKSQSLSAKAVLNDYAKPVGRLFEYRIDGEQKWHLFKNAEEMVMPSLLMGSHRLVIRLAGMSGTETMYEVSVVPSVLFIFEILFVVTSLILLLAWKRYHKRTTSLLNERNDIADALVEMDTMVEEMREELENTEPANESYKYQQMRMSKTECEDISMRMKDYLEKEHAYRNPELKRGDIAKVLHVSVAKLSYVFSQHLNVNYYDFINYYRLEEFKKLIAEGEYQTYTIQALSERCGFRKSSFFSTFRKVEGMTPAEYLRQQKVNVNM